MSRIACLRIPQFQIAVHQKHEPALKNKPLVLIEGTAGVNYGQSTIAMCSEQASARQILPGMRLSEARAVCSQLEWRHCDPSLYQFAQKELIQTLIACSPKITTEEPGILLLDASGFSYLGGESKFCRNVLRQASKAGFVNAHVGVANTAFAAEVAARQKTQRWVIVPTKQDTSFLAPLSIRHLPVAFETKEALTDLGIKTMGQLLAMPHQDLLERFGLEALLAINYAQGIDSREPKLPPQEKHFECSVDIGYPVELLNEALFVLKSMIDRLLIELKREELSAEELTLTFYSDNDKFEERPIKLIRPSNRSKFLLEVIRLSLESNPLARSFTGVSLAVSRWSNVLWEQALLNAALDEHAGRNESPDELASPIMLMLQRFLARLGNSAVVKPLPNDQHIPEYAGAWIPVLSEANEYSLVPPNKNYLKVYTADSANTSNLVLKQNPEPVPIMVKYKDTLPDAITYEGQWFHVKHLTIPDRLSGLWWDKSVFRSYYVAAVESKTGNDIYLVLLFQDHKGGQDSWYLAGFFD